MCIRLYGVTRITKKGENRGDDITRPFLNGPTLCAAGSRLVDSCLSEARVKRERERG